MPFRSSCLADDLVLRGVLGKDCEEACEKERKRSTGCELRFALGFDFGVVGVAAALGSLALGSLALEMALGTGLVGALGSGFEADLDSDLASFLR